MLSSPSFSVLTLFSLLFFFSNLVEVLSTAYVIDKHYHFFCKNSLDEVPKIRNLNLKNKCFLKEHRSRMVAKSAASFVDIFFRYQFYHWFPFYFLLFSFHLPLLSFFELASTNGMISFKKKIDFYVGKQWIRVGKKRYAH